VVSIVRMAMIDVRLIDLLFYPVETSRKCTRQQFQQTRRAGRKEGADSLNHELSPLVSRKFLVRTISTVQFLPD
jgi:hypothetical protein